MIFLFSTENKIISMKYLYLFFVLGSVLTSCTSPEGTTPSQSIDENFKWIVPTEGISGSLNFFPLAVDPQMTPANEINFIDDNFRVAMVKSGSDIRVYPYDFISKFEAVNDKIGNMEYTMTFCPKTKSGLVMNRQFKQSNFTIRASGYLFQDNQVLIDESSDTFWSQMLIKCIKGKYAGERIKTFHFVETKWATVKDYFPDALVFTNASVSNKSSKVSSKKEDLNKDNLIFGVPDQKLKSNQNENVHLFPFQDFEDGIQLKSARISSEKVLIIGNKEKHFITTYINNSNADFKAVQNQFPIIMEDSNNNKWDVFGKAVSGPRKGEQLKSLPSFFALDWAWESFYDEVFIFVD